MSSKQNDNNLTKRGERPDPRATGPDPRAKAAPLHKRSEVQPQFRSVATRSYTEPMLASSFAGPSASKHLTSALQPKSSKTIKWCVTQAKPIPVFSLERPVTVPDGALNVSARICDSLRLRSVHAQFTDCHATCKTSDFLVYTIDLYEGSEGSTIVEIMRQQGCGFAFRREREAIVNAAKGLGGRPSSKIPFMMKIPVDMLKDYEPPSQEDHEETLFRASDQLHSKQRDVQLFTLQNLSSVTTPDKVNSKSAQLMSKLIMESSGDVRDSIAAVLNTCIRENDDISEQILNACLTILSNSMGLLSDDKNTLEAILTHEGRRFAESMIDPLIVIIQDCKCSHNAYLALRCLCLLLKNSSTLRNKVDEDVRMVVENAKSFGKQRHLNLEKEAICALEVLECQ